jgi:hypothetical protein
VTIGVLLPLRLETRFDGPRLRLRVIPDEPWFDRHDPLPSAIELDDLERFLTVAGEGPVGERPISPEARAAWETFASRHGPGRAAWLVRTFPATGALDPTGRRRVQRPPELQEEARFTELSGDFPGELQVWIARGGEPELAATLTVDHERLALDPPNPEIPDDRRWWESWEEAVAAGLATELDLGSGGGGVDALYVVGLGETSPDRLFASHRDAGQLGLVAAGTATNAVDGQPVADLGTDPAVWLTLLGRPRGGDSELQVSRALTGDSLLLGPLPGGHPPRSRWARWLVAGLWPALWGHALSDVLGLGEGVEQAAEWAAANLEPVGPYPTLRVGSQPYGLLPATSLAAWRPAEGDPAVEATLREPLLRLRARWVRAAEAARGTVQGADAEGLIGLLAHPPISPSYALRVLHPMELWFLALLGTANLTSWPGLLDDWERAHRISAELGLRPHRRYGARGWTTRLRLPLVTPAGLSEGATAGTLLRSLTELAARQPATFASTAAVGEVLAQPTGSVLVRLAIRAQQVAIGDVGRGKLGIRPPALEPVAVPETISSRLSEWVRAVTPDDLDAPEGPAVAFRRVTQALTDLGDVPPEALELLLAATLDCASHRIDAWVGAPARRRLRDQLRARAPHRLGAYGWVDQPAPGQPGPTPGALLHAPSQTQALTAALLRDRAVSDPEESRWHMDVASAPVRDAARLAEEVRRGAHPAEVLGREVERAVADPERIRSLRLRFPVRAKHAGRRVLDGQRVLAADPATLGLPAATLAELDQLRKAVDVYSDLLVAEAVHHVVDGRAVTAGAALDAAAGLARPPDLEVLRTRCEGRAVETTCVVVLPDIAPPDLPGDPDALAEVPPARLADPAAAALLRARLGEPGDWRWRLTRAGQEAATVTLEDLGLDPADALALGLGDLERLVLAAVPGEGDAAEPPVIDERDGSDRYQRGARLAALLGQAPAVAGDLVERILAQATDPDPHAPGSPAAVAAELLGRLERLRAVAAALADRLDAAATEGQRRSGLRLASRWGIAPASDPALPDPLVGQVERARDQLVERLAAAPEPTADSTLDQLAIARAIAELASSSRQIAVLGRLRRDAVPPLEITGSDAPGGGLDTAWLPLVAPVRAQLARLEAMQLAAGTPAGAAPALVPWSNRPADPWQADLADTRRLVAAYAPGGLNLDSVAAGTQLAVGLLDRFTETIPSDQHTTAAAFGFDAPGARAPQAILLAIPPDPDQPLDAATIVGIVAETRELARARMATLPDLGDASGLTPLPLLPRTGETAVRLDRP